MAIESLLTWAGGSDIKRYPMAGVNELWITWNLPLRAMLRMAAGSG